MFATFLSTARSSRRAVGALLVSVVVLVGACGGSETLRADAGDDFSTSVGVAPEFDGCGSEGDIVNYSWTITSAPDSMASDVGKSLRDVASGCSFSLESAMLAEEVGSWTIELRVTDADGATNADTVNVDVTG